MIRLVFLWLKSHQVFLLFLGLLITQMLTVFELVRFRHEMSFQTASIITGPACSSNRPCVVQLDTYTIETLRGIRESRR